MLVAPLTGEINVGAVVSVNCVVKFHTADQPEVSAACAHRARQ